MSLTIRFSCALLFVCALALVTSCDKPALRESSEPSPDGGTYLVVDNDNTGLLR
jgi:hypothetical protein